MIQSQEEILKEFVFDNKVFQELLMEINENLKHAIKKRDKELGIYNFIINGYDYGDGIVLELQKKGYDVLDSRPRIRGLLVTFKY